MSKQLHAKTTEKLHFAKLQLRLLSAVQTSEQLNQINQLKAIRESVFYFFDAAWRALLAEICLQANLLPVDLNQLTFNQASELFEQANRASPELNQIASLLTDSQSWLKQLLAATQQETSVVEAKSVEKAVDSTRIMTRTATIESDPILIGQWLNKFEDLIMTLRDTMLEW